ncbi:MAG: serine hydrolase [Pseudomonadales bacterium]|nr:serine hydrolase [Pseudomonadales bacterium]
MLFLRLVVAAVAMIALQVNAADLSEGSPDAHGFSEERLERIDDFMNEAVAEETMVGGLGMIARNGAVIYTSTWGERNRERQETMTTDTLFRIYSMTKPITSVAVMMLYEEGHFNLNDPVAKYIPELADLKLAVSTAESGIEAESDGTVSRTIGEGDSASQGQLREPQRQPTIRDLLAHTAGFSYGLFGNTEVDRLYRQAGIPYAHEGLQSFVAALGKLPLQYEPGSRWHYSVSVDVQGRLVEVVSGMRFSNFLRERLFTPLGMTDTFFRVPEDKRARLAQLYQPEGTAEGLMTYLQPTRSDRLEVAHASTSRTYQTDATFESGGGGLVSSASDYLRFAQMLLNGGELDGVRVLSPKTVALMSRNHVSGGIDGRPGVGFGLGFGVAMDVGASGEIGSDGEYNWGGAAGTRFWVDPEENLIGLFMVQSRPHRTTLAQRFKTLTYQALVE